MGQAEIGNGPDGKIEFAFGREFTPLKNPGHKSEPGEKKTMPAFNRTIIFDEAGNLWIELYKENTTKYFTYDVFSPEGIYLKQVRIDQRIFQFKNGKVYSIVQPEEGYPSIKRFLMELVAEEYPRFKGLFGPTICICIDHEKHLLLGAADPRSADGLAAGFQSFL